MGTLSQYFPEPSVYVRVYRALVAVLQGDPILKGLGITWDVRKGDPGETMPPTQGMMPWIAVVPLKLPFKKETESDDQGRFTCRIDMAVAGTDWDDMGNLAYAVKQSLNYDKISPDGTSTIDQYFRAAGSNDYWVREAGVGVKRTEGTPATTNEAPPPQVIDQLASATVEFQLFVPTLMAGVDGLWQIG